MHIKKLLIYCLSASIATSCIQDEALNSEADILTFDLPESLTYANSIVSNKNITLYLMKVADTTKVKPSFTISPGATVYPDLGEYDFSQEFILTVISQDKKYKKEYTISPLTPKTENHFGFNIEDWDEKNKNFPRLKNHTYWQSGNMGLWIMPPMGIKAAYPTNPTDECVEGTGAVELTTLEGKTVNNRFYSIFSGNLFCGEFKLNMSDPTSGVMFGKPHAKESGKPVRIIGYYKYMPGQKFLDKEGNEVADKTDECTIRAFIYRVKKGALTGTLKGEDYLLGKDDILLSEQVIGIADMKDCGKQETFKRFNIPFDYGNRVIDYENFDYRLAVVFASSKRGDFFEGAVGSRLIVDNVALQFEEFN